MNHFTAPSLPSSALPPCWAITNLTMARYGRLAQGHVAGQLAEAEKKGDSETARLWRDVLAQMRRDKA